MLPAEPVFTFIVNVDEVVGPIHWVFNDRDGLSILVPNPYINYPNFVWMHTWYIDSEGVSQSNIDRVF